MEGVKSETLAMPNSDLNGLIQARSLAHEKNPEETLPKVLDTTSTIYFPQYLTKYTDIPLSRFFTDLFHEILNHPKISSIEKSLIASSHIHELYLIAQNVKDPVTYKTAVLTFANAYPLLIDLISKTSNEDTWKIMTSFKKFIISNWDTTYPLTDLNSIDLNNDVKNLGCKLASVKFISQVIIVHITPTDMDENSSMKNVIIPNNHPVLGAKKNLEREAKKYLDLLLNYLVEEVMMCSELFMGIINCLAFIMKARVRTTVRILSAILKFNIDAKYMVEGMTPLKFRLCKRMIERCYKNFVQFGMKHQLIKKDMTGTIFGDNAVDFYSLSLIHI